jgi:glycosyltransferase involved in cell wall biosynthesis
MDRREDGQSARMSEGKSATEGSAVPPIWDEATPQVSVIVPIRNGTGWLARLVGALESQTLPRTAFELVIGDDGSTDDIARFATADGWIRVASGPPRNSYAARNRAVASARGEVLAFCDADCFPEPDWLERGLEALEDADLVAGRIRFDVPEDYTAWTLIDMEWAKNHAALVKQGVAETANLFLRREVFDRVGGFDQAIDEHGDFDFVERCVAAGQRLVFGPSAVVSHPTRKRGRAVLRAQWIYCRGYAERATVRGELPDGMKLRNWIPLVWVVRARRGNKVSLLGPDTRWLAENGISPTVLDRLKTLPIIYLIVPYTRGLAQLQGWLRGRRRRRRADVGGVGF